MMFLWIPHNKVILATGWHQTLGWLWGGLSVAITSQAGALPPVCPLYTPCMPPVLNTLAIGFARPWPWQSPAPLPRGRTPGQLPETTPTA